MVIQGLSRKNLFNPFLIFDNNSYIYDPYTDTVRINANDGTGWNVFFNSKRKIFLKAGTYCMSFVQVSSQRTRCEVRASYSSSSILVSGTLNHCTFTVTEDCYICLKFLNPETSIKNIQIEEGSIRTEFDSYIKKYLVMNYEKKMEVR